MVEIVNLTKKYEDDIGKNIALDNVSFTLPNKGMVFVVGKSGCGKTTLLNIIGGLDTFTSGDVIINGQKMSEFNVSQGNNYRNHMVGFVFQDFCLIDRLSVLDNIKLSMEFQNNKEKVDYDQLLEKIGLKGFAKRTPKQLSAGQKQRVAIARAIVKNPEIILADEPTGNVDEKTSAVILDLLKAISKDKLVLLISHNLDEAYKYADRIIEMSDGKIVSDKSLNEKQVDKFYLDETKAILPGDGKINIEQLNRLNDNIRKSNGNFLLVQSEEKFVEKDLKVEKRNTKIKKVKMNRLAKIKYAFFFIKKKLMFNFFMVLLLTFITSVFALVETLGFSNLNTEFTRMAIEEDYKEFAIIKKTKDSELPGPIDEELVEEFAIKNNVTHENVYNISISLVNPSNYFYIPYGDFVQTTYSMNDGYLSESNGVVVTTMDNLKYRFDGVEVVAGEIKEDGIGVIITDYFADCIINYMDGFDSYDDIVMGNRINNTLKVDAIIKTNVYQKYDKQFDDYANVGKKDNDFINNLLTTYTYLYTLNDNFVQDYRSYFYNADESIYIFSRRIQFEQEGNFYEVLLGSGQFDNTLKGNEIKMSFSHYNAMFKTKFNSKNVHTFVPHKVKLKLIDSSKNNYVDQEFTVIGLFSREFTQDAYRISYSNYDQILDHDVYACSFTMLINQQEDEVKLFDFVSEVYKSDRKYSQRNTDFLLIFRTLELFSTFEKVFRYISLLLAFAIVFIIILNSNVIVKQNVYEIGLMKAFGAKTKELVTIFAFQMVVVSLCVCGLLYFVSQGVIALADIVLQDGVIAYIKTTAMTFDFKTIVFNIDYFFINISIVSLGTILSVIVPIMAIRKIKPLKILKTRN